MLLDQEPYDRDLILQNLSGVYQTTLTLSMRMNAWGDEALLELHKQLTTMEQEGLIIKKEPRQFGLKPTTEEQHLYDVWIARRKAPARQWWKDVFHFVAA